MPWKVTIEIRPQTVLPPPLSALETTKIELTGPSRVGVFAQAVAMALAGMRAEIRDLLPALRALRQAQVGPEPPGQPSGEAA